MKTSTIAATLLIFSGITHAEPITKLTITGGIFTFNNSSTEDLTMRDFADMTVGDYDGSAPTSSDFSSTSIATFSFFNIDNSASVYTSPSDDFNSGFVATSGDITNGLATLNFDAWTVWWNGQIFNTGSTSTQAATETCATTSDFVTNCTTPVVVDTYNATTGAFTASWAAVFVDGAFTGMTAGWAIEGVIDATPPISCDINNDNQLNVADVLLLQRFINGLK